MGLLDGKRAIITGGSRGIGRALCEVFAREGADIAFNYNVSEERAAATLDRIQSFGRRGLAFKVSVANRPAVNKMVREIHDDFGRIDILVNNAAINRGDNFATMTERAWDEVIETNVNGLFNVTKPVYKHMLRQRAGHILNLSSIGAVRALPTAVHYATSKAAVIGFTKCLSREASAFGVTVNAIAAGIFDTDLSDALPDRLLEMHRLWCAKGRRGHPEELAEFAAFMVSDRNSYMIGEVVTIDGGSIT
ncbi:MAG TPA: 3-oxoacyl-ACP reductase family protein [Blastocatellia bacterium]|jgi:3-oxoacyl-[acyl-carrier protein] reductase|nr:3-oxoacyl-ACP reductase family protein [Blastocatellia bacterium]